MNRRSRQRLTPRPMLPTVSAVKDDPSLVRLLFGALILATVFYAIGFALNERLRSRRGPWVATFDVTQNGQPRITVRQPSLGIHEVQITFLDERITDHLDSEIRFETPRTPVPFGQVKYDDLTYLPGVVTLDVFGHEIEFLPRVLYVNRRPVEWTSRTNIVLRSEDRWVGSPP